MNKAEQKKIVKLLRNDEEYYNGVGRKFRSNSDIYKLLNDPESFGKPSGTFTDIDLLLFEFICIFPATLLFPTIN